MEFLLIVCLLFNIFLLIVYALKNFVMNLNHFRFLWLLLSINIALIALFFEPKSFIDWDLLRLFQHIENIKIMGLDKALQYTEYRSLYVVKYWMYIVAQIGISGLFQSVPLFIDFCVFGYIICDIYKKRCVCISCRDALWIIFIWFSLMGIKLSISDVRCTWAMGLCCLAFYKEYICNERKIYIYGIYIISMYIHHFVIFFMIFRLLMVLKKNVKNGWMVLLGALISQSIIYTGATLIYNNINNDYIKTMARKLLADWNIYGFTNFFFRRELSMKVLYLSFVMVFVIGYIWSRKPIVYNSDDYNNLREVKLSNNSVFVLSCLGIGLSFNYLLLERLLYIVAYVFAIFVGICKAEKIYIRYEKILTPFLIYILFFNDLNIFIVNALGYYYL